jgi:peroxiredoxin Q/BCP
MKAIGDKLVLDFKVGVARDGSKEKAPFSELLEGPTIVSVYMRNNTGSCDKQMLSLNEAYSSLKKRGVSLLGISKDTVGSHLKYADRHGIQFPLISDPDHRFAKAVDSLVEKKMYGRTFWGPQRAAYLIDKKGILRGVCEQVHPSNHGGQAEELANQLEA